MSGRVAIINDFIRRSTPRGVHGTCAFHAHRGTSHVQRIEFVDVLVAADRRNDARGIDVQRQAERVYVGFRLFCLNACLRARSPISVSLTAFLVTSALTGESVPKLLRPWDSINIGSRGDEAQHRFELREYAG